MSQNDNKDWDILEFAAQTSKLIENNFKVILGLFIALIVGGSIWAYMDSVKKANEQKAFNDLYKITKIYEEKRANYAEAKAQKEAKDKAKNEKDKTAAKDEKKKDLTPATGELEKDYPEVVGQLENFLAKNLGKNASGEAALVLSEIYSEYKQDGKGAEALDKVIGKWGRKDILFYVMSMRAGDLYATVDNCDKAVKAWTNVANSESFISAQAQLKNGVCLQKLGRTDEAKIWFNKIKDKDPQSTEAFSAKRYIRYLEFKNKTLNGDDKAQTKDASDDKKS